MLTDIKSAYFYNGRCKVTREVAMANKGQFGKGKNAKKEGHKGGMTSGGNTENLNNVGDSTI